MYFNFEEDRPDTPTMARAISAREGVLLSIILHLLAVITILVLPSLPFMREAEARLSGLDGVLAAELRAAIERLPGVR